MAMCYGLPRTEARSVTQTWYILLFIVFAYFEDLKKTEL